MNGKKIGVRVLRINRTANRFKPSSFLDSNEGRHFIVGKWNPQKAIRERVGREQQLMDRLRTATVHFADAQIVRAWAISSAHQAGLSIRRIASATDLSPSRVHQVLNCAEATDMPAWLSRLRETDNCLVGKDETGPAGSNAEMCSRLASEVKVLRRCIDWLEGVVRRNPRKFLHPSLRAATSSSKSIILPSL